MRKRICPGVAIAQAVNHIASSIDKACTSKSAKISLERIFSNLSMIGLGVFELLATYDVLIQDTRKFESFYCLPTQLKKP